ncbi:Oxidoreductase family, NAD-binding Rossmann fold, partial [Candidatus Fervidibacteria bacterium JGI MDM2 JNZ-1-D12]
AVSVCSPHHLHAEHCIEALSRGVHVLCEKPLVWLSAGRLDEALEQSRKVVNLAVERNLQFAVNTQYVAAVPYLLQIWDEQGLPKIPEQPLKASISHLSFAFPTKILPLKFDLGN